MSSPWRPPPRLTASRVQVGAILLTAHRAASTDIFEGWEGPGNGLRKFEGLREGPHRSLEGHEGAWPSRGRGAGGGGEAPSKALQFGEDVGVRENEVRGLAGRDGMLEDWPGDTGSNSLGDSVGRKSASRRFVSESFWSGHGLSAKVATKFEEEDTRNEDNHADGDNELFDNFGDDFANTGEEHGNLEEDETVRHRRVGIDQDDSEDEDEYLDRRLRQQRYNFGSQDDSNMPASGGEDDASAEHIVCTKDSSLITLVRCNDPGLLRASLEEMPDPEAVIWVNFDAFCEAAWEDYSEIVKIFIEYHADVNHFDVLPYDPKLTTPLLCATSASSLDVMKLLLLSDAHPDTAEAEEGQSALHIAAEFRSAAAVKVLLENKANLDLKDEGGRSPLFVAATYNNLEVAQALLDGKADPALISAKGWTPLAEAAWSGAADVARALLKIDRVVVDSKDQFSKTPLMRAIYRGNLDIVEMLLNKRADIKHGDKNDETPLVWAARCERMDPSQPQNACLRCAELLLNLKADPLVSTKDNTTALWYAAVNAKHELVERLLKLDSRVNMQNKAGQTGLWWAARAHDGLKMVELLLEHRADVNLSDVEKFSPLSEAAYAGSWKIADAFMYAKADVDAADMYGKTPLCRAASAGHKELVSLLLNNRADIDHAAAYPTRGSSDRGETPLFFAVRYGHRTVMQQLLNQRADIDHRNADHQTVLFAAVENDWVTIVEYLIEHNSNPNAVDKDGETVLFRAAATGANAIVRYILHINKDAAMSKNRETKTPLFAAAQSGYEETIELLIREGRADVDHPTQDGRTPLFEASSYGHVEAVRTLLNSGAHERIKNKDRQLAFHEAAKHGKYEVIEYFFNFWFSKSWMDVFDKDGNTAIVFAAKSCSDNVVKYLLDRRASPFLKPKDGMLAVCWVAKLCENQEINERLLKAYQAKKDKGKLKDPNCIDEEDGKGPLFWIGARGNVDLMRQWLDLGANVSQLDENGWSVLLECATHGRLDAVDLILDSGANPNHPDQSGQTALFKAASQNFPQIISSLLKRDADVTHCDNEGSTPLHMACGGRQHLATAVLVDHLKPLDINVQDKAGKTPLIRLMDTSCHEEKEDKNKKSHDGVAPPPDNLDADAPGSPEEETDDEENQEGKIVKHPFQRFEGPIARLLLNRGANLDIQDHRGISAKHLIDRCKVTDSNRGVDRGDSTWTALHWAADDCDYDSVFWALIFHMDSQVWNGKRETARELVLKRIAEQDAKKGTFPRGYTLQSCLRVDDELLKTLDKAAYWNDVVAGCFVAFVALVSTAEIFGDVSSMKKPVLRRQVPKSVARFLPLGLLAFGSLGNVGVAWWIRESCLPSLLCAVVALVMLGLSRRFTDGSDAAKQLAAARRRGEHFGRLFWPCTETCVWLWTAFVLTQSYSRERQLLTSSALMVLAALFKLWEVGGKRCQTGCFAMARFSLASLWVSLLAFYSTKCVIGRVASMQRTPPALILLSVVAFAELARPIRRLQIRAPGRRRWWGYRHLSDPEGEHHRCDLATPQDATSMNSISFHRPRPSAGASLSSSSSSLPLFESRFISPGPSLGERGVFPTHGLRDMLGLSYDEIEDTLERGVEALEEEISTYGDANDRDVMRYILTGRGQIEEDLPLLVKQEIESGHDDCGRLKADEFDEGHLGFRLSDFMMLENVRTAKLSEVELVALRFYTSPGSHKIVQLLRAMVRPHPFRRTVFFIAQGLKKLRYDALHRIGQEGHDMPHVLYRGMKGLKIDLQAFKTTRATELGLVSTTSKKAIARCSRNGEVPVLFRYNLGQANVGVSLKFCSLYPNQNEYVYPPLTFLKYVDSYENNEGMFVIEVEPEWDWER